MTFSKHPVPISLQVEEFISDQPPNKNAFIKFSSNTPHNHWCNPVAWSYFKTHYHIPYAKYQILFVMVHFQVQQL